jgi:toxin FitB
MNLVDSCGWLEYFADASGAVFFAPAIEKTAELIVPTICLYEVFKRVLEQRGEDSAIEAVALMRQGQVAEINEAIALNAARLSHTLKMPMADSMILATAQDHQATIWTQDSHFAQIKGVRFRAYKK